MSGYSSEEIIRMQQDAVRRAQDMQRRARGVSGRSAPPPPAPPKRPHPEPVPRPGNRQAPNRSGRNLLHLLNFQNLEMDSDTILILLIFFILASDDGDIYTLMSLLYLLI